MVRARSETRHVSRSRPRRLDLTSSPPIFLSASPRRPPSAHIMAPSAQALRTLATLRSRIFATAAPPSVPGGVRTGAKFLRQRLVGPSMLRYYPAQLNYKSFNALEPSLPKLLDPRETQRLKDVERKKVLGKGPPKKGEFG